MGMYRYFWKNVTFNDLFVLNSLNVANCYIFKCQKVKNGGGIPGFLDELGPFLVVYWKNWWITAHYSKMFSFFGRYIFQLFSTLKVMGRYIFQFLETLKITAVTFKK